LSETMDTYIPKYENDESFIMASHVDRLQQSDCFKDGGVSCISCHNPHKSVTTFDNNYFNNKCISCHVNCEETPKNMECVSCHMPKSSSTDIPHVSITDHNISVHSNSKEVKGSFKELICINNDSPTNLSKAKAYLKHYESFAQDPMLLDSAFMFLKRCGKEESLPSYIQYFYLNKDYESLINHHESIKLSQYVKLFSENTLSLTYRRIAEAYYNDNNHKKSYQLYLKSVDLSPNNLDFLFETAKVELELARIENSEEYLKLSIERLNRIIKLNPNFTEAYYELAYIIYHLDKDNYLQSKNLLEKAILLNPDYYDAIEQLNRINKIIDDKN